MAALIRHVHRTYIRPTGRTIALGIRLNHLIWTKYFDAAWEQIPMHEKLTWILFVSNTLAILSLLQFLAI